MAVLQQYYTSFVNKNTGHAGFQIKAMSPNMSQEMQMLISRLITYRIPDGMDERAIQTHPVALRYYYHNPQECILLCSQSCGNDENSRPGNFFAHSVVLPSASLTIRPPILYWRSPFWGQETTETDYIPVSQEFQAPPSTGLIHQMWSFLADDERQQALYALMSAVIHSRSTNRRIIIIDKDEHVALWIAAVSCMLPPAYRPLLSFSTYHHDPYQSWFLITGTTPDVFSTSDLQDSGSHFILDGRTNKTSSVKGSLYAKTVKMYASRDAYQQYMLQLFADCERRFPPPTRIDEGLESLALYMRLRKRKEAENLEKHWLPTIDTVLTTFSHLPQVSEVMDDDRQELAEWVDMLDNARADSTNIAIHKLYQKAVEISHQLHLPLDGIIPRELRYQARLVLMQQKELAVPIPVIVDTLKELERRYGEATLVKFANQPEYARDITILAQKASPEQLRDLWTSIGPYLRPVPQWQPLFVRSISVCCDLTSRENRHLFFSIIEKVLISREQEWFQLLRDAHDMPAPDVTLRFYWHFAQKLSLEQREPYRDAVCQGIPDILIHELRFDLAASTQVAVKLLATIRKWLRYAEHVQSLTPAFVVQESLSYLQKHPIQQEQRKELLTQLLLSDDVHPFLAKMEIGVVEEVFSTITLSQFLPEHVTLYKRYLECECLSDLQRTILAGLVAMAERYCDTTLAQRLYDYVSQLPDDVYYSEAVAFFTRFLRENIASNMHTLLISALFTGTEQKHFWYAYWNALVEMFARAGDGELERLVRLLSFWFELLPGQFTQPQQRYMVQTFFFNLPSNLRDLQKLPGAAKTFAALNSLATDYKWYSLLVEVQRERSKLMEFISPGLIKLVQQRLPSRKVEDEQAKQRHTLRGELIALLGKGSLAQQHIQSLMPLYLQCTPTLFWTAYADLLQQLLLLNDAEYAFEVFQFWFDEAFRHFGQEPYIAQGFFCKLPSTLAPIKQLRQEALRKTVHTFDSYYQQQCQRGQTHEWYPLLRSFLC
jgi:hypothetical protein